MNLRLFKASSRVSSRWILLAMAVISPQLAQARALQCQDLPSLFRLYLQSHYAFSTITDTIKTHTVDQFIKGLDPSKTTLLEADVTKLKRDLPVVFDTMQTGVCASLDGAFKLLADRTKENEVFVKKFLGDNYKFDDSIELMLDPDKRGYPKTASEKEDLIKKMVHFNVSSYLLSDTKLPEAKRLLLKRYELASKRATDRKPEDALDSYTEAFAEALDPHSSFFTQDSLEEFQISMQLSLEGIGASLTNQDGYTVVEEIIPGGSADRAKALRPKDKIIAVGQGVEKPVSVVDMDLKDVVKLIRGKKGTKVHLTVLRQAEKTENIDVTIVRDKIDLKEQAAKITYDTRKVGGKSFKVGIIDLPSFYGGGNASSRSSYTDMKNLLVEAKKQKVDGIVLDLSRNGGGLLEDAVRISGLFLKKGGVVATQNTQRKIEVLADEDPEVNFQGPLVVLISRLSASASEILAGALRDYGRAVIVGGDHTFGKGTVQSLMPLPQNLGAMKVTVGMFFIPKGNSTQHRGVESDVVLPSVFSTDEVGEKALDYSLPPQSIATFVSPEANDETPDHHWKPIENAWKSKLSEQSKARISKDPKFTEIRKEIEESQKNKGIIRLADLRKKRSAEKKDGKGKKKDESDRAAEKQKEKDSETPYTTEATSVVVDLIQIES